MLEQFFFTLSWFGCGIGGTFFLLAGYYQSKYNGSSEQQIDRSKGQTAEYIIIPWLILTVVSISYLIAYYTI